MYQDIIELKSEKLSSFQVISAQHFSRSNSIQMTLWYDGISFSQGSYLALHECDYVSMRIDDEGKKILVLPIMSSDRNAIMWKKRGGKNGFKKLECQALMRCIFAMWHFDAENHYRTFGSTVSVDGKIMLLFDFTYAEQRCGKKMVDSNA